MITPGAEVRIAEHLLARKNADVIAPLIDQLRARAASFFGAQGRHVRRHGLPYLWNRWPKPSQLDELAALGSVNGFESPTFESQFERIISAAYGAGVAGAYTDLGIDGAFIDPRRLKSGAELRLQIDRKTRDDLTKVILAGEQEESGRRALTAAVRALFAEWAKSRAQGIATFEVSSAYHRAMLDVAGKLDGQLVAEAATIKPTTGRKSRHAVRKVWVVQPNCCPICEGNADEGDIPSKNPFESGHMAPPAHPHCVCSLTLIQF